MARKPGRRERKPKKTPPRKAVEATQPARPSQRTTSQPPSPGRRIWGRLAGPRTLPRNFKSNPVLLLPLVIGGLCAAWVLYNANRPWVKVDALVATRDVRMDSQTDDEGDTTYFFYATIEYVYDIGEKQFLSVFDDNRVDEASRDTRDFPEAVVEAKRYKLGEGVPVYVDSRHPDVSTKTLPGRVLPLFGLAVATLGLLLFAEMGAIVVLLLGAGLMYGTWSMTRLPQAAELRTPEQLRPFLEVVRSYPSLGYVPQNKLRVKFASLEELLKSWGRPDALWIEDVDSSHVLTLTYRHGSDWSQAWSVDLALGGSGAPVPIDVPRRDDPER